MKQETAAAAVRGLPRRRVLAGLGLLLAQPWAAAAGAVVRVGVYRNPPKIDFHPEAGAQGLFADMIEAVARAEGWQLQYVPGTFQEGLERLRRGAIDLMVDVARTPEREPLYAFHGEPVLHSWSQVYARRGSGIRTLLDLSGRRVSVLAGSAQEHYLAGMAASFGVHTTLVPQPDYELVLREVLAGRADALVTNPLHGGLRVAAAGLEDTAIIFAPSRLFFAAPRGAGTRWLAAIDRRLKALKADPRSAYYDSMRRWARFQREPRLPGWLPWAGAGAGAALLLASGWALTMHRLSRRLRSSERRQRELAQERHRLVAHLEQRTEELQRANGDLQAFSQSVSHDLRAPVSAIAGFVDKVLRDSHDRLEERSRHLLTRAAAAAGRMDQIIDDLLRLARLSAEPVQRQPVDLGALATGIADALRQAHPGHPVEFVAEPGLQVQADPRLLRLALENLLANGWKFTRGTAQPRVTLGREPGPHGPVFYVRDNGAGFDMEHASQLFVPFQRLHSQQEFEGTGVGLSIVQRVVARHGGRIWGEGAPGQGAVFRFTLA